MKEEHRFILIPQQVSMHMKCYKYKSFADQLHIDIPIIIGMLLLFTISCLTLYSAKLELFIVHKQLIRILFSFWRVIVGSL